MARQTRAGNDRRALLGRSALYRSDHAGRRRYLRI